MQKFGIMQQKTKITLGFVSMHNPLNRRGSSGTAYKVYENLINIGYDVYWIPVKNTILYKIYCIFVYYFIKITKRNFIRERTSLASYILSLSIEKKQIEKADMLFCYFSDYVTSRIKTNKPIVFFSDSTFISMIDYYPEYTNLFDFNKNQGIKMNKKSMQIADTIILSSEWAKKSAINSYNLTEKKVNIVELGANIDERDIININRKVVEPLHLLFLGVWWERKGGDIAVEACKKLNEKGIKSILHIVGAHEVSESIKALPYIDYIGFLDKNIPTQYNKLVDTIKLCHCLLLPTKAECSAIAFAESSANGLPIFSHDTGGVSNYVFAGKNGYLLPLGSTGEDFANKIAECYKSGELQQMSETARDVYREKLNWNVWAQKVKIIIDDLYKKCNNK